MKVRTFKHHPLEECSLCQKVINTERDKWVSLIDLEADEISCVKFYHRFCLTDLIKGQGRIIAEKFKDKLQKVTGELLKNLKPAIDKMNKENQKVYEIKN